MKNNIIEKFNLPNYIKGKSFSEASKLIENKFKDREDKYSLDTKNVLMERLSNAQEFIKSQNKTPESNQFKEGGNLTGYLNLAETGMDFGNQIFGKTGIDTTGNTQMHVDDVSMTSGIAGNAMKGASAGMMFGPVGAGIGAGIGAISSLIGNNKAKKDVLKAQKNNDFIVNSQYKNDFALGGNIDSNCGGPGQPPCKELDTTDISPVKEATNIEFTQAGLNQLFNKNGDNQANNELDIGKYKKVNYFDIEKGFNNSYNLTNTENNPNNKDTINRLYDYINKRNPGVDINYNFKEKNEFKQGGKMNSYFDGGSFSDPEEETTQRPISKSIDNLPFSKGQTEFNFSESAPLKNFTPDYNKQIESNKDNKFSLSDIDLGNILRYSPVATNALQLSKMKKPKYESLNKLDNRYKPQLIDEMSLQNVIENQYGDITNRLAGTSNGSQGALRANLQGSHLNKIKALSDAYMKSTSINNSEKSKSQQFNLNVDKTNLRQDNLERDINARNLGAFETNKSKLISQLGTDIGNIGKEEMLKKYPEKMGFLYNSKGDYIGRVDKDGRFISSEKDKKK